MSECKMVIIFFDATYVHTHVHISRSDRLYVRAARGMKEMVLCVLSVTQAIISK